MSRSREDSVLTTRSPIVIVPLLMSSSPATIRSAVLLPQPDGPTRTRNSPSAMSRSRSRTAWNPFSYCLLTLSRITCAIGLSFARGQRGSGDPPDSERGPVAGQADEAVGTGGQRGAVAVRHPDEQRHGVAGRRL